MLLIRIYAGINRPLQYLIDSVGTIIILFIKDVIKVKILDVKQSRL